MYVIWGKIEQKIIQAQNKWQWKKQTKKNKQPMNREKMLQFTSKTSPMSRENRNSGNTGWYVSRKFQVNEEVFQSVS